MAKQTINIGAAPNDGNGDTVRDAFDKANDNFDELYIGAETVAADAKTTPVDADVVPVQDSEASNVKKRVTWANIKATLKTYFDTLYVALTGNQTVAGVKTFSSFPVTPSSAPTTDYQVANKKYVDDNAGGGGASIDFAVGVVDFGSPADGVNITAMVQITSINIPVSILVEAQGNLDINYMYENTVNSYSGAKNILPRSLDGSILDFEVIQLLPNLYYGFEVSIGIGGSIYLYDLSDLSYIDQITFNPAGGGP